MKSKNSKVYAYFNEETKKKYKAFLQEEKEDISEEKELELFQPGKPFEEFALIISKQKVKCKNLKKKLPNTFYFKQSREENGTNNLIISTKKISKEKSLLFSGYGIINQKVIVGNKEATKKKEIENFYEGIGNFTFLAKENEKIVIGKDYFGLGRIFYYHTDEYSIISNEYHLLLLIMSGLKLRMELDEDVVISNFAFFKGQLFEQHLSKKMEVKGVLQLPLEKYICIEKGNLYLRDTSLPNNLKEDLKIENYEKLLKEAAEEIKNNIEIIYEYERFKYMLVDVTGGIDSRIVFSAITNMKDEEKKFQTHTFDDKRTKDITVAIPLCNLFSYPYDNIPIKKELKEREVEEKIARSLNMGVYYYHDFYRSRIYGKNAVRLLGGGGEAVVRPYYTRYLVKDNISNIKEEEKFVTELLGRKPENALLPYEDGIEKCIATFSDELTTTIGESPLQKYENSYIFLRSGPHLSHKRVITEGFLEWNPIYSKKIFYLKEKTYSLFKNSKLAFDLIKYFNSILVGLPYEKDVNNIEYQTIKKQLIKTNENIEEDIENIEWNTDDTKWKEANKEKVIKYKGYKKIEEDREFYYQGIREAFHFCMKHCNDTLNNALGLPIYHWLEINKDSETDLSTIYHKMYSLADQIKIIESVWA